MSLLPDVLDELPRPELRADPSIGMPMVYINLDEDASRRMHLEGELNRLDLQASRLQAVRWTRLSEAAQNALYSPQLNLRQYHVPLVAGEKGCYASHLLACDTLLRSSFEALVVLEDDITLDPALPAVLRAVHARLGARSGVDLVKLMGRDREKIRSRERLDATCQPTRSWTHYRRVPSLTAGQVVTREGARKMLTHHRPFGRPVDIDQRHWWEAGLVIRGVHPEVVHHASLHQDSSIGAKGNERPTGVQWRKFRWKLAYTLNNAWR